MLMAGLAPVIAQYVDRATAPLLDRIASLEAREPVVVEKVAVEPPDWRKSVDAVSLESRAILGDLKGQISELTTQVRERADAAEGRVTAALALVKNGEPGASVTLDDVRPSIEAEIARLFDEAPRPPDADEVAAAIDAQIDRRLPDVAERAASLVKRPEPLQLPDIGAIVSGEFDGRVGGLAAKAAALIPSPDIAGSVAAEFDRRLPDVARRAADLVPPAEPPPLDVAGAVSSALLEKMEPIAKLASEMVKSPDAPTLPDIPAMVRTEVAEATGGFAADFASPADAEKIARDAIEDALKALPTGLTIDEIRAGLPPPITLGDVEPLIERALTALPKAEDIGGLVDVAMRDGLAVPDHMRALLERVGELLSQPFAATLDSGISATVLPRKKTITTSRDAQGNLTAVVTETSEE